MPDALPPVGVLLSALDAATLPLAGTELAFVMQGGQPKRTPVSNIGSALAFYARRGTYAPTVTPNSGTTASAPTAWPWTRIGNGAGAPAAGDVVCVRGKFPASRGVAGQGVVSFTLPFVADPTTSVGLVNAYVLSTGATLSALAGLDDANAGSITITDLEANALVQFEITYQTANAVDP
jgi:hypothetical protein